MYRIAVDAGFTCPNRACGKDSRKSTGCLYCSVDGSRASYAGNKADCIGGLAERLASLKEQVQSGLQLMRNRYGARQFLLYFQAYSGTYADTKELASIYEYGLSLEYFRELIVASRPDCIDTEKAELLRSFATKNRDVWIELGLQSSCDATLRRIQRGHTVDQFVEAFNLCRNAGIKITVHLIFGLPGETEADMLQTVDFVSQLRPEGLKIHNLHICNDAPLYDHYLRGEIVAPVMERHLHTVQKALRRVPPETVIMRLTCDTRDQNRAAPRVVMHKNVFLQKLTTQMENSCSAQGDLFSENGGSRTHQY